MSLWKTLFDRGSKPTPQVASATPPLHVPPSPPSDPPAGGPNQPVAFERPTTSGEGIADIIVSSSDGRPPIQVSKDVLKDLLGFVLTVAIPTRMDLDSLHGAFRYRLRSTHGIAEADADRVAVHLWNVIFKQACASVPGLGAAPLLTICPSDLRTPLQPTRVLTNATPIETPEFINTISMKLIRIEPGEFLMGSPAGEEGRKDDETQHKVKITKPFFMQTTPVTQSQWESVMGSNPSDFNDSTDALPVETVSWTDAIEFCQRLGLKEGRHYRLPTEAEWEYACRAGTQSAYGGTGNIKEMGWYAGNYPGRRKGETIPVAWKTRNAWGLFDMHGNVSEWCNDWYGEYPVGDATDPTGPIDGTSRVLRGGSWYNTPLNCRAATRSRAEPGYSNNEVGFRVCLEG